MSVYELGYLLAGLPDERVAAEADGIREVVTKNGGTIIAEETPHHERLAYTMRKKMVSGSYNKYDEAHFGWIKFEAASSKAAAVKNAVDTREPVLRTLLITTVRENTYLGKRAPAVAAAFAKKGPEEAAPGVGAAKKDTVAAAPATVEEMDKSIDEMVKEV